LLHVISSEMARDHSIPPEGEKDGKRGMELKEMRRRQPLVAFQFQCFIIFSMMVLIPAANSTWMLASANIRSLAVALFD